MPLEMTIDVTVMRKIRYSKLLQECSKTAKVATLISSGGSLPVFINLESCQNLKAPPAKESQAGGRSG